MTFLLFPLASCPPWLLEFSPFHLSIVNSYLASVSSDSLPVLRLDVSTFVLAKLFIGDRNHSLVASEYASFSSTRSSHVALTFLVRLCFQLVSYNLSHRLDHIHVIQILYQVDRGKSSVESYCQFGAGEAALSPFASPLLTLFFLSSS